GPIDRLDGFRKMALRPTRRSSLGWLKTVLRLQSYLRLRLEENFDRFNFEIHKEKEMVSFRRCMLALTVLALFAGLASAQVIGQNQLTCATNVSVTPTLRS